MKKVLLLVLFLSFSLNAQTGSSVDSEKEAIKNCALDYGIGWYSGDAVRMERALHPELNKILVMKIKPDGNTVLQYSSVSGLVESARGKAGLLEEGKRNASVDVYDVNGNFACAKLNSAQFNDYLSMVKVDGAWKILNVLWNPGPASPQKPLVKDFNPESEKGNIDRAARDLVQGIIEGDASKAEKVIHPEINLVQAAILQSTGKLYVNRFGHSFFIEMVKAKFTLLPENQRNMDIIIMDSSDGYSFVKCTTPSMVFYIQMAKIDGEWKAINVLLSRVAPVKK